MVRQKDRPMPGDVVQIDPAHDERFGGCFMQVTERKDWGVQGFVKVPAGGMAFYRVAYEHIEYVGTATWVDETTGKGKRGTPDEVAAKLNGEAK